MKLWQRLYIFSILLFFITFNFGALSLIERSHNEYLKQEINQGFSEYSSIYSGINASLPLFDILNLYSKGYNQLDKETVGIFVQNYLDKYENKSVFIEIRDTEDNLIFSNADLKVIGSRVELSGLSPSKQNYIIRDMGEKSYLFISGLITLNQDNYKLSYIRNITQVYKERQEQYGFFLKLDVLITLLFSIFMYFISRMIKNPISQLIASSRRIAGGNFAERVQINTHDELGMLAHNFNTMAEVIEKHIDELQRKNEEQERFIHNLTHEIKTPLTSIIGYANLLRRTRYDEQRYTEGLDYIYQEGKRLEQLSNRMKSLLTIGRDDINLCHESLPELLQEIKVSMLPQLKEKGIEITVEGSNAEIMMEKELLRILVSNLLDNALKASSAGSVIKIQVISQEDAVSLIILDQGTGMEKQHLDKVFEPFYTADLARSRKYSGLGLGLAICRKIVDLHGAEIKIESVPGQGTAVTVIFPVQEDTQIQQLVTEEQS